MAMNSVNTNTGALVALQSLNRTNDEMAVSQKRISTGLRVADAKDDGAAFAVSQKVKADMSGLTSANEQLGGVKGILDTTHAALNNISTTMKDIRSVLVKMGDETLGAAEFSQYSAQYTKMRQQVTDFISDAFYNGRTLLNTAPASGGGDINTVRNENGGTTTITSVDGAATLIVAAAPGTAAAARTAIQAGGDFETVQTAINNALNKFGNDSKAVDSQITYNKQKMDALESGLGALVDADLAKESARMQSLQIRQQLGTTALTTANQAPQALLSLFR
jgi:flagellin